MSRSPHGTWRRVPGVHRFGVLRLKQCSALAADEEEPPGGRAAAGPHLVQGAASTSNSPAAGSTASSKLRPLTVRWMAPTWGGWARRSTSRASPASQGPGPDAHPSPVAAAGRRRTGGGRRRSAPDGRAGRAVTVARSSGSVIRQSRCVTAPSRCAARTGGSGSRWVEDGRRRRPRRGRRAGSARRWPGRPASGRAGRRPGPA